MASSCEVVKWDGGVGVRVSEDWGQGGVRSREAEAEAEAEANLELFVGLVAVNVE